ncbi:nucleic acid-binding, OB-fold protein [Artemisia annua]|uniref:Nucleic acid-binding, OB-fold protein n=1 Tax=Artemisia annua TaxID=35608 RepID=A0A2U1NYL7_ARTAN|nr:nucleic acid-binding, OB-fold protein [Artemisia annua]
MALTGDANALSKPMVQPPALQRSLAYFADLKPTENTKFIEARVYHKWTAMKVPSLIATGFSCILLDKKGSAIQANADLKEKERFEHGLQANCVYIIEGFGFEKTDSWGKTLDNDFTLCLGKHTRTDLLQDNDFPYHYFSFAAYNELGTRLDKKNPILTGYIHNVEKVKEYGSAAGNKIKVRNIALRNLNNNVVLFTLWNDKAENFEEAEYAQMQQPVILAVSSCYLKTYDGQIQLSVTSATHYYFNPPIEETSELLAAYNNISLSEVMILQVDTAYDWYYQKCDECGGKLDYGFVHGHCHPYGSQSYPQNSYSFRIIMTDGTGNAVMTCFSPQTDGLIKDVMDHPPSPLRTITEGTSSAVVTPPDSLTYTQTSPPPTTPTSVQKATADTPSEKNLPSMSATRKELFKDPTDEEGYVDTISRPGNLTITKQTTADTATEERPSESTNPPTASNIRKVIMDGSEGEKNDYGTKKQKLE